jgi:hypothetical protein
MPGYSQLLSRCSHRKTHHGDQREKVVAWKMIDGAENQAVAEGCAKDPTRRSARKEKHDGEG